MRIDVTNLSKIIRGSVILDNISIHFESGHIYGIIGKNGSGKTMLLRAISGLIVPSSGVVYVDGKALGTEISFPPEIGILIEKPEFLGHLSGFENLKMLSEIKGSISDANIAEYMNYFDLDPEEKKPVRKYSQGMKQKLGIIQAIMENQNLLVLDEPFNALDEKSVKLFRELLIEYKKQEKLIILTSIKSTTSPLITLSIRLPIPPATISDMDHIYFGFFTLFESIRYSITTITTAVNSMRNSCFPSRILKAAPGFLS